MELANVEYSLVDLFGNRLEIEIEIGSSTERQYQLYNQVSEGAYTLLIVLPQMEHVDQFVKHISSFIQMNIEFTGLFIDSDESMVSLIAPRPITRYEQDWIVIMVNGIIYKTNNDV